VMSDAVLLWAVMMSGPIVMKRLVQNKKSLLVRIFSLHIEHND
jgi:hypothetical protein